MAKRRGILLAGLAAGAYAYFKKPENREKATVAFNNAKTKVNSFMESQNLDKLNKTSTDGQESTKEREKEMVNEGGEPGVQYYNEDKKADENAKLSSNDTSEEKSENTKTVSPEPRIGTDNI